MEDFPRHIALLALVRSGTQELAEDGIAPGDWFVVCGIRPGLKVKVAGEWRLNDVATK